LYAGSAGAERSGIHMDQVLYFIANPSRAALDAARDGLDRIIRRVSAQRQQSVHLAFEQSAARALAKLRSGGADALVIDARGEIGGVERFVGNESRGICGSRLRAMLEDAGFELFLDGVGEFHTGVGEELDPIVLKGVVGGGNDHACLKIALADEAGHAGGGDDSRKSNSCAGFGEASGENGGDVGAGFAGVHADEDMGGAVFAVEIGAEGAADGKESGVVERRSAGDAADAVGAEEFFSH